MLDGGAGFDRLFGGSGNDTLRNGEVNDGGSGAEPGRAAGVAAGRHLRDDAADDA